MFIFGKLSTLHTSLIILSTKTTEFKFNDESFYGTLIELCHDSSIILLNQDVLKYEEAIGLNKDINKS